MDLEAIEMAVRSAMHQAGAAALTELLQIRRPGRPTSGTSRVPAATTAQYREIALQSRC